MIPSFLLILVSICISVTNSANVLFLPSTLYPVHSYTMKFLAEELVNRKHQVTWLEYGPAQPKNVLPKEVKSIFWRVPFEDKSLTDLYVTRDHKHYGKLWDPDYEARNEQTTGWLASVRICDRLLKNHKADFDKIVSQKFDTVIVDDLYNPCGLLLAELKGAAFIYWSMTALRTESAWANQSPSPPSYLPVPGTKRTDDLTFSERVYNLASYLKALYVHQHIVQTRIDAVFQKYYPGVTSAFLMERNASLNYVNTPPIFDFARPFMPRVNFVGGLHCKNATALKGDLFTFVAGANEDDGFVVLSTGFTALWRKAPRRVKMSIYHSIDTYLEVFNAYPKVRFVWQYDGATIEKKPSNLYVAEWLPLQDLLGHPKCIAHISHGGLNSVIESVWHGVPMIGLPLTASGYDNLLRVTARGAGIMIDKQSFSSETLTDALRDIRHKKFKEEMEVFQEMVRDVPFTELTHAAFWVEFIDRHQEIPHARSGADKLNIFQYFLVDVFAFILSITYIIFYLIYLLIRTFFVVVFALLRRLTGRTAVEQHPQEKKWKHISKDKKKN